MPKSDQDQTTTMILWVFGIALLLAVLFAAFGSGNQPLRPVRTVPDRPYEYIKDSRCTYCKGSGKNAWGNPCTHCSGGAERSNVPQPYSSGPPSAESCSECGGTNWIFDPISRQRRCEDCLNR
jgi:hypothetical protein